MVIFHSYVKLPKGKSHSIRFQSFFLRPVGDEFSSRKCPPKRRKTTATAPAMGHMVSQAVPQVDSAGEEKLSQEIVGSIHCYTCGYLCAYYMYARYYIHTPYIYTIIYSHYYILYINIYIYIYTPNSIYTLYYTYTLNSMS